MAEARRLLRRSQSNTDMPKRPRIPSLPSRIQMMQSSRIPQAPRPQRDGTAQRKTGRALMDTRKRIWLRDGARCVDCGELVDIQGGTARPCEIDHEVPLWAGGSDDDGNRRLRCVGCHAAKSAREAADRARGGVLMGRCD